MFVGNRRVLSQAGPLMVRFKKNKPRLPEKIPVQLLKNIPTIGSAGEIIRVRPAYMRNFLHQNNKAAYILKGEGPRIPIVEKEQIEVVVTEEVIVEPVQVKPTSPEKSKAGAMSLDELSNLFNTMKNKRSKDISADQEFSASTEEVTYTLSELKESIPTPYTIHGSEFPITKEYLASAIFDLSGNQVATSAIKIGQDKSFVSEVTKAGKYKWIIASTAEKSSITIPLIVN